MRAFVDALSVERLHRRAGDGCIRVGASQQHHLRVATEAQVDACDLRPFDPPADIAVVIDQPRKQRVAILVRPVHPPLPPRRPSGAGRHGPAP